MNTNTEQSPSEAAVNRLIIQNHRNTAAIKARLETKQYQLARLKGQIHKALEDIEEAITPDTGWMVLLVLKDGVWKSQGCYDFNNLREDQELPEFHIIMPIPRPDSLRDWEGV